jgi:predicted CoA-substrate-specific enzyme activase
MADVLNKCGLNISQVSYIIATGYGRMNVPFADRQLTEMTCHARGVASMFPRVRLAIDIGGQDSKALRIVGGKLIDFVMNDKCAAGTGRFIEVTAEVLGLRLDDLARVSAGSSCRVSISSTCTVFAQQEVMARLSEGSSVADVVAGLYESIASRTGRMARRLKIEPDIVFTGGVAKNPGVVRAIEENLGCPVHVPEEPLLSGALGAAIIAIETFTRAADRGEMLPKAMRELKDTTFFGPENV